MLKKTAAIAALPLMAVAVAVAPAHAYPDDGIDTPPNYNVFLQAIAGDGIVMDKHQAIQEAQGVCKLMQPPNDGSLWDAGQHMLSIHRDWTISSALSFADRAVQDLCPNRGAF
ncbi:DUF732 domain-containing protein [Mycobacterium sp. E1747]|uniref:DUF732 domain-containing protein n=1 Tax=Mycobacterium sp. E1747 TaxID=1834128 RepID=UPI000800D2BD|nr:DUF732 domain-containing protein [Mycobacterium sp. E1747]OBH11134.1 hypothetical protein A5695_20215 [Mycobacterium sp. E1747]